MEKQLWEKQARAMAIIIRNIFAKTAIFENFYIYNKTWNKFQYLLEKSLKEEYKNDIKGISTCDMLDVKKWQKFNEIFDLLNLPKEILLENMYFHFSHNYSGDIIVFNTLKGQKQNIGTFNMNEHGEICFLNSHQVDNMDPLTSITNFAWLVSNQARRFSQRIKEKDREKRNLSFEIFELQ